MPLPNWTLEVLPPIVLILENLRPPPTEHGRAVRLKADEDSANFGLACWE